MIDGRREHKGAVAEAVAGERADAAGPPASAGAPVSPPADGPVSPAAAGSTSAQAGAGSNGAGGSLHRMLGAIGPRFVAMGVKADQVTVLGMLLAGATGVVIGLGQLYLAVVLLTVGGLMDTLDGAVAKAAGTSSKRGAFFDSVSDRVADGFIFGGLAWYFAAGPGHAPKLALIPVAILGVSNTISYERAKAESLGFVAKGGLMERAERLIALGAALLLHFILVPLLCALLGLCVMTAWLRFVKVWRQASDPDHGAPAGASAAVAAVSGTGVGAHGLAGLGLGGTGFGGRRIVRVESRWRAWRDASSDPDRRPRRVAVASRARSRRRPEPLSIRLRRAFHTELGGSLTGTRTSARTGQARSERRRQGAESSFRRRLGSGR